VTIAPGQFVGRLEVLESLGDAGGGVELWQCRCTCGQTAYELTTDLEAWDVVSCGDCGFGPPWSPAEEELLRREHSDTPNRDLAIRLDRTRPAIKSRSTYLGLKKSEAFMASGASGRIQPGTVPPNKGRRGGPVHPNSRRTQFKPGQRGNKWQPLGTEKLSKEGYLLRKVSDTGYPPRDWRQVHRLVWEAAGREIPEGRVLCFVNGDRRDIRLENLELVHRADLMRRNTRHNLPPELREIHVLRAALHRKICRRERELDEEPHG